MLSRLSDSISAASKQASEVQLIERMVLDNIRIRELAKRLGMSRLALTLLDCVLVPLTSKLQLFCFKDNS